MVASKVDDSVQPKIGFALGGGAVRGAAHLGFLSVFEDAGIKPDFIAGTSAGAIVGAGYAAGLTVAEMSTLVNSTGWRDVTNIAWRQRLSVFDTTPLRRWIEGAMGEVDFVDLQIPLSVVACNILNGRRVVLHEGSVVRAAVASSAIPGLFSPEEWDDMLLVDGGLVDNLPVSAVRDMGADIVVAVDVSPSLRQALRPDSIRDVVTAAVNITASNTQINARTDADYLVQPDIEKFSPWDFGKVPELEEAGRRAAQLVVEKVLDALG